MNWADLVLLGILALSTLVGLMRGFVVEALSLAVWVAAFWLAFLYGDRVAALFAAVDAPSARLFLGYAAVFLAAILVGGLLTWLVGKLVSSTGLSGTDRLLGLVFGLARGAALACVVVLLLGFTPMPQDPWWRESRLLPTFERGAREMKTWLPAAVADHVRFGLPLPAPVDGPTSEEAPDERGPEAGS